MGNCINSSVSNTIFHPQLGHLQKEYQENYTIQYFKAKSKLITKQKYERWQSQVRRLKYNPETKNFLYIPQKIVLKERDIFQNQPYIEIYYSPYIQTLQDLLSRYKSKEQYPCQQMIWYLIYSFTKVGKYFEKIGCKIGTINFQNVVISTDRQIKIICQKSTFDSIDPIDEVKLHLSHKILLAPQELQALNRTHPTKALEQINPQISEVFSIGILVLSVANMFEPHKIYDYHSENNNFPSINFDEITNLLSQMKKKKRFSDLLIQTICEMIEIKPEKRTKSTQLFKRLSQYEHEILSKKGLHYSGEEIEKIKDSLNGSFASRTVNNSHFSGTNTLLFTNQSLGVSEISVTGDEKGKSDSNSEDYQNLQNFHMKRDFVNIL